MRPPTGTWCGVAKAGNCIGDPIALVAACGVEGLARTSVGSGLVRVGIGGWRITEHAPGRDS